MMTGLFGYFTSDAAPFQFSGAPFFMGAVLVLGALVFAIRILSRKSVVDA